MSGSSAAAPRVGPRGRPRTPTGRPPPWRTPPARRARAGARRGLTLVELIATIVVLAALGSTASLIIFNAADGYLASATTAQLHAEASVALDRIARELRRIELDGTAASLAPDIDAFSATSVTWSGDSILRLTGTNLELVEDGAAAAVLLSDVSAFSLAAYDESDAALSLPLSGAACDPIRRVAVSVTLTRDGVSETLGCKVCLRGTMSGTSS